LRLEPVGSSVAAQSPAQVAQQSGATHRPGAPQTSNLLLDSAGGRVHGGDSALIHEATERLERGGGERAAASSHTGARPLLAGRSGAQGSTSGVPGGRFARIPLSRFPLVSRIFGNIVTNH
jgi:hypothetical protein